MSELPDIQIWAKRATAAKREAHQILAQHEQATSRVIILEKLLSRLSGLPVDIQDYFQEAASCLEMNFLRAAIVMAWAGHFHVYSEKLYQKHEADIRQIRQKWNFKDLTELKEKIVEIQILEVGKDVKFINNAQLRVLQGQLSTRNQCAHATLYRPSLNSAIGYVDELLRQTIEYIAP